MADLKNPEDSLAQEVNASDENTLVWYRSSATKIWYELTPLALIGASRIQTSEWKDIYLLTENFMLT